jgi:hypothetical protein
MVILARVTAADPPASTDVFVERSGGYFAYRIPAIETAPDGSLLAFAENITSMIQASAIRTSTSSTAGAPTAERLGRR